MNRQRLIENISDSNRVGVEVLITDSRTALMFLDLAETSEQVAAKSRRITEAHQAYQFVVSLLPRLEPTAE